MAEEREWTPGQKNAIDTRGRTLLVSAAAGSGKTSVLTERIIRAVTDPESPIDIGRILAVTYTRSAARDLRDKLGRALRDALSRSPGNARLLAQIAVLGAAHICTIDSFCLDLVRQYSSTLGVSRSFRIADGAEDLLLCTSVMDDLICDLYDGVADDCRIGERSVSAEEFSSAADLLTSSKEEGSLGDVLFSLWESCSGYPDGTARVTASAAAIASADSPLECDGYREAALGELSEFFSHYRAAFSAYLTPFASEPKLDKYLDAAEYGVDYCKRAEEILRSETPSRIVEHLVSHLPPAIRLSKKGLSEDLVELAGLFKADRGTFSDSIKDFLTRYFSYTAPEHDELRRRLCRQLEVIAAVVDTYDRRLDYERRVRGVLSFRDLEALTLELLGGKDGKPTREAREIAERFDLVFVDEYQDVNPIQHSIFTLLSREDNLFMVGDVKQSIYSFRGAAPEVFTSLRASFPPLAEADPNGGPAAIDMSSNFRSDRGVIDFVNLVFDRAFTLFADRSGYIPERDRLLYAKKPERSLEESAKTVFAVFSRPQKEEPKEDGERDDGQSELGSTIGEFEFVIDEIRRLVREEGRRLSDFAVLVRGWKQYSRVTEALDASGIPSDGGSDDFFFSSPEILLALCLLHSVDNPRRDVYLAGLMMSPLFGFAPDELVAIRIDGRGERGETLWEALRNYCERRPDYDRGRDFIARLGRFRRISEGLPSDRLIWRLYEETDLFAAVGDGEDGRARERLLTLYDLARSFEGGSYSGLWSFLSYVGELIEKSKLPTAEGNGSREGERVRVVTAHSSKGLEFPICFLCSCETEYNFASLRDNLIFDGSLGASLRLRTDDGYAFVDNPYRNIACDRIKRLQREEELRLLYVALTRAREKLYVCASPKSSKRLDAVMASLTSEQPPIAPLTPWSIFTAKSFFDTLTAILPHASAEERRCFEVLDLREAKREDAERLMTDRSSAAPAESEPLSEEELAEIARLGEELARRFEFEYPNKTLTTLPKKLSVSTLRDDLLDSPAAISEEEVESVAEYETENIEEREEGEEKPPHLPRFMGGVDEGEAARRGIATHYFMQFCDFERLRNGGVERELERLRESGFISDADADRVRLGELRRFAESPLFGEMLAAREIRREMRFNLNVRAADFTRDPARADALGERTLLVQGVIDCVFRSSDGELVLVDYKTDRPPRRDMSRAEFAAELVRRHSSQLTYYKDAIERMFGERPARTLIYSLYLGDTVEIVEN